MSGSPDWVGAAVAKAEAKVDGIPAELRPAARVALAKVTANRDAIGFVTQEAFNRIVELLESGQDDEARAVYLGSHATFRERMDALKRASIETRVEAAARFQAWAKVEAVALDILKALGPLALQFLVSLL